MFAGNLRRFRSADAIVCDDGKRLSYADLADRVADFVARLGPQKRLILVEAANELPAVVAYLAALAGRHAVIMAAEASDRLTDTFRPDAIFRRVPAGWQLKLTPPEGGLHPDLALLLSTSGTTGATKLVRLSAGAVAANAASIATYLDLGPGERAPTTLPIHYSYGLSVLNSHLASGGTLLLTARSLLDEHLWDFVGREGGTSLAGVPYSYELLDRIGFWQRGLPTLRTLTQAGGRLPASVATRVGEWARAHGIRFFIMYGQTEATARMAYLPPERLMDAPDCIGIAIPGGTLELAGSDGPITAPETEGELIYRGPNVMMGYALGRDDLARGAEIGALQTHDLAVQRADGLFRITGRASRMAKPFGLRVSFDEIERQLAEQGIQAAVTGTDALISITVVGSLPSGSDAPGALGTEIAARLKLPESLFDVGAMAELPRLANGKTDYRALLAAAESRQRAMQSEGDGNVRIAAIFQRAFPAERQSRDASFAGMGGDSLSYVQVSIALEDALGNLPERWETLTIAELEALVAQRPAAEQSWLARIDSEILLRALALIAVIVNHASDYPVGGGSDLLMLLAGYSLARFQSGRLFAGQGFRVIRDYFIRIMIPYLAILLLYAIFRKPVPVWNFLFVGNYLPTQGGFLTPFWFLDALFQLYLLSMCFCLLPNIRAAGRHHPFQLAISFVAVAFAVKFGALLNFPQISGVLANRTVDASLALFAIGWLIWFAHSRCQKLIAMGAALLLALPTAGLVPALAIWSHNDPIVGETRALWLLASTGILLYLVRLPIFAWLRAPIVRISGAGYHIYLIHGVIVFVVLTYAKWTPLVITIAGAILFGLLLNAAMDLMRRQTDRLLIVTQMARRPRVDTCRESAT
jgi:acyl-coenzyme A synthetase/AMP-(fatty) acid ligase/peptidoglycan/LPS O-acetylase OafA/YrhL